MKNSFRIFIPAGAAAVCLLLAGCDSGEQAPAAAPKPLVTTVTLEPETVVLRTELPGRTASYRVAEIRPQVSGLLQKRLFTEGADVEAGEVLYQIDAAPFEAEVASAKANLAAAEKAADQARATLALAKINEERYGALYEEKAVAASERDQAATDYDVAQASVLAAEAAIEQAKAALLTAQINLDYTKIRAPIAGRIGRSSVTDGAIVMAYQAQALASVQQIDPIYVDVPQSTSELLALRRHLDAGNLDRSGETLSEVELIFEDGTRYPHKGTLQFQEVTVDPSTGSVILRMVFPNPEGLLLPGMYVRVEVKEGVNDKAVLITQQGVARNPKGEAVALVVDESGTVIQRLLEIDRSIDGRWLVTSGLKAGDRVIVEGSQKVRPGAEVKTIAFDPNAGPATAPAPAAQEDSSTEKTAPAAE
ncbi:efflux RND transporter periplasmic adaptor subunit [Ruficoccus amylovorans]|uniref:Efflux RND transporter periplasmic adaptor subunit n=1 Tax=Ruficoccus amylovorans TaxID=1804625 RepID=A0A842HMC8_9BACT|nr:efflux RND transporter periplasmic adaptor subunit [Ruficoccus amylovorans]MBC2596241.1 efflux RND transporter periplasmic adaptor subunit [Ruficoccus amylovorans]